MDPFVSESVMFGGGTQIGRKLINLFKGQFLSDFDLIFFFSPLFVIEFDDA